MGSLTRLTRLRLALGLLVALPAAACEVPDEGNRPWRGSVARVKYLPETETWAAGAMRDGALVSYTVAIDELRRSGGRCWWPVEVRADGKLWKRYLVTTDARELREELRPALAK